MESTPLARTPEGARWSCRSCGDCCRGFDFGPVEPAIVDGLIARDVAAHWAPASEAPWFERRATPDGEAIFFTHRDGHCVFLRDDALCAIHGLWGAEAKPAFCREYPLHVLEDPEGVVVVARSDCGGLHESFVDGEPVQAQVASVLALPEIRPRRRFAPEQVVLLPPNLGVSADAWMVVERALLEVLRGPARDPRAAVAALRERMYAMVGRAAPAPDRARYEAALEALLDVLGHTLQGGDPRGDYRERLVAAVAGAVGAARTGADAPLSDAGGAYLNLVLRSSLLAKRFTAVGGVPFGLGAYLLATEIGRRGHAVAAVGPGEVGPRIARFERLAAHPALLDLLRRGRGALADLFLHAA